MSMPWTNYFRNGVPAQVLASLNQEESLRHTQLVRGGAHCAAATSTTGTGRTASPLLAEGGKHAAALQEWTLPLGYPRWAAWLACAAAGLRGPRHLVRMVSAVQLRLSPTAAFGSH